MIFSRKFCKQIEPRLDAYYDNELNTRERQDVEEHLSECSSCTAKLGDIERLITNLKAIPATQLSYDLSEKIESLINLPKNNKVVWMPARAWMTAGALVSIASAIILLVLAFAPRNLSLIFPSNIITASLPESSLPKASMQSNLKESSVPETFEVAVFTEENNGTLAEALGVTEDEDGLYELNM